MKSRLFTKRDALEKADAIVVLTGNGWERTRFGIELYKQGWAPFFVVVGSTGSRPAPQMAVTAAEAGIPKEKILIEDKSRNTRQNAENVLALAKNRGWEKIIMITSLHHQWRAHLTFQKVLRETGTRLTIINYPPTDSSWLDKLESSRNPQLSVRRFWYLFSELFRIVKYRLKGDL